MPVKKQVKATRKEIIERLTHEHSLRAAEKSRERVSQGNPDTPVRAEPRINYQYLEELVERYRAAATDYFDSVGVYNNVAEYNTRTRYRTEPSTSNSPSQRQERVQAPNPRAEPRTSPRHHYSSSIYRDYIVASSSPRSPRSRP